MNEVTLNHAAPSGGSAITMAVTPTPRVLLNVRSASTADVVFIDALQKMHSHMVGWFPRKQIEKYIDEGNVLVAEELAKSGASGGAVQMGYCIAKDQYMKRDDVGIVYQLNVMPLRHRNLVGASLVKAAFDKAAYGCRLFSCWCAQDIQANWFWESLGFIPLAFRTGSAAKQRIHIFWQRRIRDNDDSTPFWFPAQTSAGAVGQDRIVLPIPPGTHWRDAKPLILPGMPHCSESSATIPTTLPGGQPVRPRPEQPKLSRAERAAIMRSQSKHLGGVPLGKKAVIRGGRIKYVDRTDYVPDVDAPEPWENPKPKRIAKPRVKNDPKFIAAARELRDRYLEQVNADRMLPAAHGKYDVSRQLAAAPSTVEPTRLLDAA